MGNVEMHQLSAVRDDERKELDLSSPINHDSYCKHIKGEYSHKCLSDLPQTVTDSISLHERVNLSFNCLTTIPAELPLRIPHISFLDLSHNRISQLPDSIGLFFHLKELLLCHNKLEQLPITITRLVKLEKLDVSQNKITSLPDNIGNMESLRKLNVSHNSLSSLPRSLGSCEALSVLLAASNNCESQPPQRVCESGSVQTIRFLRQLASGRMLSKREREANIFPRIRDNIIHSSVPNSASARAQYVQIQTATMNTASRIRTPLLPPYDATQLHPEDLKDKIVGLIYGAVIGDALGIGTEFLSQDECQFHYDKDSFTYDDIIRDEHRVHWSRGDWTSNSDQMLLVLESILQWAGVVDELEFARRLVAWTDTGIAEIGERQNCMLSTTVNLVLQQPDYSDNPHKVAEDVHKDSGFGLTNGVNNHSLKSSLFMDCGAMTRSIILGVPRFHDLNEVLANSSRICLATHFDERCVTACVAISVAVALMLQGKYSLEDSVSMDDLLKIAVQYGLNYSKDESVEREFKYFCSISDFHKIGISELGKDCHPFKAIAAAFASLRQCKDFKSVLCSLLMFGGYSSMTGCLAGALMGCKFGYSRLPKVWIEGLLEQNKAYLNKKINSLLDMMGLP